MSLFQKLITTGDDLRVGRGDLTNEQWEKLELLLPRGKKAGRPPKRTERHLINGVRFRVRTGYGEACSGGGSATGPGSGS